MIEAERRARIVRTFEERFGRLPTHIIRAPGRVNLIGEHTDYNGLPVLPMAIERNVMIAAAAGDDRRVRLANVDARFPKREYELAADPKPWPPGDWGNYHKAASGGLWELLGGDALRGGDFVVDGNVPTGAGLSSSSAFVVGSAFALLAVSERGVDPTALAEQMARAERYVGTMSGGMDQAVCVLARAGHALRIDFDPLRCTQVPIAPGYSFVVCNSLVVAEKSGAAKAAYNQRVTECREACRVLGDALALAPPPRHLGDLLARSGRAESDLVDLLRSRGASEVVARRTRHVISESARVDRAQVALGNGDWATVGELMNASHASCRDDYEISCPELEELVATARACGAIGSRLTGAGFGGCTVNLVAARDVEAFLGQIEERFFAARTLGAGERCFVFTPCQGATAERLV